MQWTNAFNLPQPLVSAIRNDRYERIGNISITGLLRPPRMRVLEARHTNQISEDVADNIWRLLGQSIHAILERSDTNNHLAEERMIAEVLDWKISGQPDLLGPDGTLSDYKVTSIFSFLLGDKPEWEAQLNLYAWLYRRHSFSIKKLQIIAILRDWVSSRAGQEDYPKCGIMVVDIPLWSDEKCQAFVEERVRLHKEAEVIKSDELSACTPEERWLKPDSWAVKKASNIKAYRVFDNISDATNLAVEKQMIVEHRPGKAIRCERFCNAAPFCNIFQATKKKKKEAAI